MRVPFPKVGEEWAYRSSIGSTAERVLVSSIRGGAEPYFQVAFLDASGPSVRQLWVPLLPLIAPWVDVGNYLRNERSWERVRSLFSLVDRPEEVALSIAFECLIDPRLAHQAELDQSGVAVISDVEGLYRELGLSRDLLSNDEYAFWDGTDVVVPWPITRKIAIAACRTFSSEVMAQVQKWEAGREGRAKNGTDWQGPEEAARLDQEWYAPAYDLLRAWSHVDLLENHVALEGIKSRLRALSDEVSSLQLLLPNVEQSV